MTDLSVSIIVFIIASLLVALSQFVQVKYESKVRAYFLFIVSILLFVLSASLIEGIDKIGQFLQLILVFAGMFYMASIMYFINKITAK